MCMRERERRRGEGGGCDVGRGKEGWEGWGGLGGGGVVAANLV